MIKKEVSTGIWRGSQPLTTGDYISLSTFKSIIKLNLNNLNQEYAFCKEKGIILNALFMSEVMNPSRKILDNAVNLIKAIPKPVYIHCLHGHERTGIVIAEYRREVEGMSNWGAVKEALKEGFSPLFLWWFL